MLTSKQTKMKYTPILLSLILFLAACRTAGHVYEGDPARISIGMTKDEVFRKVGKPETDTTEGNAEICTYTLNRPWWQTSRFHVKFVDGKVQSSDVSDH